jgi:hypothetical protein
MSINFLTDAMFDAAMKVVEATPSSGGGGRNPPPLRTLEGTNGSFSFRLIKRHWVTEH